MAELIQDEKCLVFISGNYSLAVKNAAGYRPRPEMPSTTEEASFLTKLQREHTAIPGTTATTYASH